jgi:hypothetical protein
LVVAGYKHFAPTERKPTLDTLTKFIEDHWGDIASVVGVLISLIGFGITIWGVLRSKNAAQRAEEAAKDVRQSLLKVDTVMELSAATTIMEEIKRLHRASAWVVLLDRYSTLRRLLISIKSANPQLADEHLSALQSAVQHFTDIERKVERSITAGNNPPNVASLNENRERGCVSGGISWLLCSLVNPSDTIGAALW